MALIGLVVPADPESGETEIPFDLTQTGSGSVGQIYNEWSVRHGHILFHIALRESRQAKVKGERKKSLSRFRARYGTDYKTKTELQEAFDSLEETEEIDDELLELDMEITLLKGLEAAYKTWRESASREITRRTHEQAPRD